MAVSLLLITVALGALTLAGQKLALFPPLPAAEWKKHKLAGWEWVLGTALVLASNFPLLRLLPHLLHSPPGMAGDARTHAAIAALIARWNLKSGWADTFMGGFPLGVHYPPLGWLSAALLTKLGLSAAWSTNFLGVLCLLLAPWLTFVLSRRAGASFLPAVAASFAVTYTAPYYGFVGGYEAFLATGLYAQVTSIPFMVGLAYALATDGPRYRAPLLGALAVLAHPQVTFALMLCSALPAIVVFSRAAFERYVRGGLGVVAMAGAVYGPGLATLKVPFGWPRFEEWKIIGRPISDVRRWIDFGELVDWGRPPVVTAAWVLAFGFCALLLRRKAPRAAAVLLAASLGASMIGHAFQRMGRLGELLLSFLQPLRVMTVLPLCVAFGVAVAGTELGAKLKAMLAPLLGDRWALRAAAAFATCVLGVGSYGALGTRVQRAGEYSRSAREGCAARGFDQNVVRHWVRGLRGGRLWFDDLGPLMGCADSSGFESESGVPIGLTAAIGAHVGVHWLAARAIALGSAVSAQRAEGLAVRYVLHLDDVAPVHDEGWRVRHRHGNMMISERIGGTDVLDVGCRVERWRGSDKVLRDAVNGDLQSGVARALSLGEFIELTTEEQRGTLATEPVSDPSCDASDARVDEDRTRVPGTFRGTVRSSAPVDVVIRAANYPWWHVYVDDREVPWFTLSPGYLGVRVPAGTHRVHAEVLVPTRYPAGIALAWLAVFALGIPEGALARLRRKRGAQNSATVADPRNE